jgi:hypothetical protein
MTVISEIKRGQWLVIRVDGAEELNQGEPSREEVHRPIGATCCDSVTLQFADGADSIVMLVDDTSMLTDKPIIPKATKLYRGRCKPGTTHSIRGDVAIVVEAKEAE